MNSQIFSAVIAIISLLVSVVACWLAKSSLSQAEQVAEWDRKDWKKRKWFDLYFKADEAYDCLDRFRTLYGATSEFDRAPLECEQDWNNLVLTMRAVHRMASVFPKSPVIDELFAVTSVFSRPEALSKERLEKVSDAVDNIRQKALMDATVLE